MSRAHLCTCALYVLCAYAFVNVIERACAAHLADYEKKSVWVCLEFRLKIGKITTSFLLGKL